MKRTALMVVLVLGLATAFGVVGQTANAQRSTDARVADLVQAGKLRVGVGVVAPHWAVKDPRTSELRGVAVEVARALATRIGIELVLVDIRAPLAFWKA
jgi:ABC-type amino acid transport substrate-binding protein